MTDCVVSLDTFRFQDLEVPEQIPFGGEQGLVVQQLPGGARIIDAMGREDAPLEWSGTFLGPNALQRARYLDYLRAEGQTHTLTWHQFRYSVVVRQFKAGFMRYYRLPYSISLEVIADLAQPVVSFPTTSVDTQISTDNATAQTLGTSIGDGALSSLLSTMDSAISAVSSFATATTDTINSVLQPIQAVQQRTQTLLSSVTNTLQNIASGGGLFPGNPVSARIAKMNAEIAGAQQTPLLVQLQSVTGRMSTNLSLINGAANARSIATAGTNLYQLAAKYYGDATQWPVIAKANGITDPSLGSSITKLSIPNQPGSATGGILTP